MKNLYYIIGLPFMGKSSLARAFRTTLDTVLIPTDVIFWRWCDKYHPEETKKARYSIGPHFLNLPESLRREWFEFLTKYILKKRKHANPDLVVEGWLLLHMPTDLKQKLMQETNFLQISMDRYNARTRFGVFHPKGNNYADVVKGLREKMKS